MPGERPVAEESPEMVEGPFYAGGGDFRSDIRDGQSGENLDLTITIVNCQTGAPLAGADVDLWQCNSTGHYSGYDVDPDALPTNLENGQEPTNAERFLRGKQTTDASGEVAFKTIYPGWYTLRTPHIHLKIFTGGRCNITTQLYLPESLSQDIFQQKEAYRRAATQDTFNKTDPVIGKASGDADAMWVDICQTADGFTGTATIKADPATDREPIFIPAGYVPPLGGFDHKKPVR
jgi:protocatechuate 3,4-dioxygenase beta subunit